MGNWWVDFMDKVQRLGKNVFASGLGAGTAERYVKFLIIYGQLWCFLV